MKLKKTNKVFCRRAILAELDINCDEAWRYYTEIEYWLKVSVTHDEYETEIAFDKQSSFWLSWLIHHEKAQEWLVRKGFAEKEKKEDVVLVRILVYKGDSEWIKTKFEHSVISLTGKYREANGTISSREWDRKVFSPNKMVDWIRGVTGDI